jgi:hypothetical protein
MRASVLCSEDLEMGMDGTGSGPCSVAGSGISGVEPSGSATASRHSFFCVYYLTNST